MSIKERTEEFHALIQRMDRIRDNMPSEPKQQRIWGDTLWDIRQQADELIYLSIDGDYLKELRRRNELQ